jgi:hypothetical protein
MALQREMFSTKILQGSTSGMELLKIQTASGHVGSTYNPSIWEVKAGGSWFQASQGKKKVRPYFKEQAGCVATYLYPSYPGSGVRKVWG